MVTVGQLAAVSNLRTDKGTKTARMTTTHANEYSKINAVYGPCNYKAVNWETSEEAYTTEQYEEFAAAFDAATKA